MPRPQTFARGSLVHYRDMVGMVASDPITSTGLTFYRVEFEDGDRLLPDSMLQPHSAVILAFNRRAPLVASGQCIG